MIVGRRRAAPIVGALLAVAAACGTDPPPVLAADEAEVAPAPDGRLDCTTDAGWAEQGSIDPNATGLPTSSDALGETLARYARGDDGVIVTIEPGLGSLVVDGREQVVAVATEVEAGGWIVHTITGCRGFDR